MAPASCGIFGSREEEDKIVGTFRSAHETLDRFVGERQEPILCFGRMFLQRGQSLRWRVLPHPEAQSFSSFYYFLICYNFSKIKLKKNRYVKFVE